MLMINDCRYHLVQAGITMPDADQLRRIAMTLHRWHELECGNGNNYGSWAVVRGRLKRERVQTEAGLNVRRDVFEYDDAGEPYIEYHLHSGATRYTRTPDKERGAQKRLAKIMARYPGYVAYVQTDPRGAALYILRPDDVKTGDDDVSGYYTRGIAVYK